MRTVTGYRFGAPVHSARKLCPECGTQITGNVEEEIVQCPKCETPLMYETLEHRLRDIETRLTRMENEVETARSSLADRIKDRGLEALRARVKRIEEQLG